LKGWHKIAIVHWCSLDSGGHSALEFKYTGPDTRNKWKYIPQDKLRAGVSKESIDGLNRDSERQKKIGLMMH